MAYQVLARQWRPRSFSEVVGQDAVLKSLIHALDQNRLHHAYLFTGTRGVGKTSLARIMAKCLNCEKGISSRPCGQCSSCLEIDQGRSLDLIEIDAASKTKVEDTRELLDNVQYAPTKSRFKIYLIDEVHMLSLHSFNALLKTLEEPPPHVKFLLATTDPKKLPITVLSRCLQFCLRNIDPVVISLQLEKILQHENIVYEVEALKLISRAAAGSMRDALSLLDQAISYGEGRVALSLTQTMLGAVDDQLLINLLKAIAKQDPIQTQQYLTELLEISTDLLMTAHSLAALLFEIAQSQVFPNAPEGQFLPEAVHELAKLIPAEWVQIYYQMVIKAQEDIPLAPALKLGFEMLVLRLYAFAPAKTISTVDPLPAQPLSVPQPRVQQSPVKPPPVQQPLVQQPLVQQQQSGVGLDWVALVNQLPISGMVKQLASHCALLEFSGNNLKLSIAKQQASFASEMLLDKLEKAISSQLGRAVKINLQKSEESSPNSINPIAVTPAQVQIEKKETQQKSAENSLSHDSVAQYIQTELSAKLAEGSVVPVKSD